MLIFLRGPQKVRRIFMQVSDPGMGLVIGMGLGTVFIGLICIIAICYAMGAVIKKLWV